MSIQVEVYRPQKPARFGTPEYAVQQAIRKIGGVAELAHRANVALSTAHAWTNPDIPGRMPLAVALSVTSAACPVFAEEFARKAGGTFLPGSVPATTVSELAVMHLREQTEFFTRYVEAHADGARTAAEALNLLKEANDMLRVAGQLCAALMTEQECKTGRGPAPSRV